MRYAWILVCVPTLLSGTLRAEDRADVAGLVRRLQSKSVDEALAALAEAAQVHDKRLVSPLAKLLRHDLLVVRERAPEALALRKDPADRKKAASAVADRLKPLGKEETRDERLKAIQALHDLAQPHTIKPLLEGTGQAALDRAELRARLLAVANVPTKEAVDRIIQFGSSGRRGRGNRRAVTVEALRYATQADLPRGDIDVLRKWWSDHRRDFDPVAAADERARKRLEAEEKERKKKKRKKRNAK